jgi:hypothetical protein
MAGDMAQVVEHLPSKWEVLSSTSSTEGEEKKSDRQHRVKWLRSWTLEPGPTIHRAYDLG